MNLNFYIIVIFFYYFYYHFSLNCFFLGVYNTYIPIFSTYIKNLIYKIIHITILGFKFYFLFIQFILTFLFKLIFNYLLLLNFLNYLF